MPVPRSKQKEEEKGEQEEREDEQDLHTRKKGIFVNIIVDEKE